MKWVSIHEFHKNAPVLGCCRPHSSKPQGRSAGHDNGCFAAAAATAAALKVPRVIRSAIYGMSASMYIRDSAVLVLPRTMAPASRSRFTNGPSSVARWFF